MQQQMMQQSRQLDPNLLMKQQTPPSQQQSLHQPTMKSFLENVIPHTTPELQKGPSPINSFSSFPIGGFLHANFIQSVSAFVTTGRSLSFNFAWSPPRLKTTAIAVLLVFSILTVVVIPYGTHPIYLCSPSNFFHKYSHFQKLLYLLVLNVLCSYRMSVSFYFFLFLWVPKIN